MSAVGRGASEGSFDAKALANERKHRVTFVEAGHERRARAIHRKKSVLAELA
jgi:hypothetical protein